MTIWIWLIYKWSEWKVNWSSKIWLRELNWHTSREMEVLKCIYLLIDLILDDNVVNWNAMNNNCEERDE